jgi:AraC-like DNA-binding protein
VTGFRRPTQYERLRLARAFLDGHYRMPLTIKRLSQEAALSPYHFIRLFRQAYQQTPHQYLIQRRLERAKELLQSSDLSITDICAEVGFESLGSFSALFRKATGLPPSVYREKSSRQAHSVYIPLCACILHGIPLDS